METQTETQTETQEDVINLLEYWRVIWKRKVFLILLVTASAFAGGFSALFMPDIYCSTAVITPIGSKDGVGGIPSMAQQFSGLTGMMSSGSSSMEIMNLLKSNILKEKMIEKYNLLPVLFPKQWDAEKGAWKQVEKKKQGLSIRKILGTLIPKIRPVQPKAISKMEDDGSPTVWQSIRALNGMIAVRNNVRDNVITIAIEFDDPELAAKLVDYLLTTLNDYMRGEAKRVAQANRRYLEEQLSKTADPLIRQKIYNLMASQIETAMMSEVKENFAFKIIDPSKAPDIKIKPVRRNVVLSWVASSLLMGLFIVFFLDYIGKMKNREGKEK
ncbi:MAG TPA: hypothetical protein DCL44_10915 [Elusimicrobia bacterium]|nr:hypothetical protein [Elusimicrobiota bacterium]